MLDPLLTTRLIFILGIINLVTGTSIFFSCRCIPGSGLGKRLMKYQGYQRFFKYHCYIWWIFWPSVIVHATLALILFGWPS
jgi:hypothetical protein